MGVNIMVDEEKTKVEEVAQFWELLQNPDYKIITFDIVPKYDEYGSKGFGPSNLEVWINARRVSRLVGCEIKFSEGAEYHIDVGLVFVVPYLNAEGNYEFNRFSFTISFGRIHDCKVVFEGAERLGVD